MEKLVKAFDMKPGCSRAGVVTFADNATTDIDFDMYDDYKDFSEALKQIPMFGKSNPFQLSLLLYNIK